MDLYSALRSDSLLWWVRHLFIFAWSEPMSVWKRTLLCRYNIKMPLIGWHTVRVRETAAHYWSTAKKSKNLSEDCWVESVSIFALIWTFRWRMDLNEVELMTLYQGLNPGQACYLSQHDSNSWHFSHSVQNIIYVKAEEEISLVTFLKNL